MISHFILVLFLKFFLKAGNLSTILGKTGIQNTFKNICLLDIYEQDSKYAFFILKIIQQSICFNRKHRNKMCYSKVTNRKLPVLCVFLPKREML